MTRQAPQQGPDAARKAYRGSQARAERGGNGRTHPLAAELHQPGRRCADALPLDLHTGRRNQGHGSERDHRRARRPLVDRAQEQDQGRAPSAGNTPSRSPGRPCRGRGTPAPGRGAQGLPVPLHGGVSGTWSRSRSASRCTTACRTARPTRISFVPKWAPHDLRRTGRTMLAALGCPTEVGEAILGCRWRAACRRRYGPPCRPPPSALG